MSLWTRNKPLSQPPHFRSGQDTTPPVDQVAKEAQNLCGMPAMSAATH